MTDAQIEQRKKAMGRSNGLCPICGRPLISGQMQYAHAIGQREIYRKKYGSFIIDHTLNGKMVCSLACNQSVDVGSSYGNHLEIISDIVIYEIKKMWGIKGLENLADKILKEYKNLGVELVQ